MTEISNSQFFTNPNSNSFEMWKSTSNGALNWDNSGNNNNNSNPLKASGNILKNSTNSFQPLSSSSSNIQPPQSSSSSSTTTTPSTPAASVSSLTSQFSSMGFDPLKVPSSIKNSQFINITSQSETNWLSQSDSLVQPPRRGLVKAYSEDNIQPPLSIQQQLQSQQQQQDLENDKHQQQFQPHHSQDDIEDEITGQNRYKTELCRSFAETGVCRYGLKCQFAHGKDELRPVMRHPKYKTEACKTFYSVGSCPYGARCRFIHTRDPEMMNSLSSSSGNISPSSINSQSQLPPPLFANEVLTKSLPQMIRQHSSPQLQTPLYILQQHKELQQKNKEKILEKEKEKIQQQQQQQQQQQEQQQSQDKESASPVKQPPTISSHPKTLHWSNSWSSDEASSTAPGKDSNSTSPTSQLKSSNPPLLKKEDSSKRLAIFKTICSSNSSWS